MNTLTLLKDIAALWIIGIAIMIMACLAGCDDQLRFAASESQKQVALATAVNANAVRQGGCDPGSEISEQLVDGTQTNLDYIGTPKIFDLEDFDYDSVATLAQADSTNRPTVEDAWNVADDWIDLAIMIVSLGTGAGAIKATRYLIAARERSTALKEIVKGNEKLKTLLKTKDVGLLADFKEAMAAQSKTTQTLVTQLKS